MTVRTINLRQKGQITLPAEIRHELGLMDGDRLLVERRGKEIVLISPDDVVDRTAGALAEYAKNGPLEWDREELWKEITSERENRVHQQMQEESSNEHD